MRVFSVNAWRFSISVGRWDRFTSWGTKIKDDQETVFNETTLGQIIDNFAARKNDIAMCYDHQSAYVEQNGQPAPALAFYNALALVVDGRVVKFASHKDEVQPPSPEGLENGIYGYRCEVTPFGEKLLPGYKYISPMFTDQGADEAGNPIGYDLMDVAATNTPFQDGVGLTFHRTGSSNMSKAIKMDDSDLMARLGLDADADDAQMKAAFKAYLKKMDDDALAKKMDDADAAASMKKLDDGSSDDTSAMDDGDDASMKKLDDASDSDGAAMADGDDDSSMKKLAKDLGCEPSIKSISDAVTVLRFSTSPKTEMAKLAKKVSELEARLAKEDAVKAQEAASKFAKKAVADGRWNPGEEKTLAELFSEKPALAEKALQPKGTWTVLNRVTTGGEVIGKERQASEDFSDANKEEGGVIGLDVSTEAKKYASENNVSFSQALTHIAATKPQMYRRSDK